MFKNSNMKLFRFLTIEDDYDVKYHDWSRIYEYPAIIKVIKEHFPKSKNISIHNTACGDQGTSPLFKKELLKVCTKFRESDKSAKEPQFLRVHDIYDLVEVYPITGEKYDVVINVSVLEEITPSHHRQRALENLWAQVAPQGLLILTCDYPRVSLGFLESNFGHSCNISEDIDLLHGQNSMAPHDSYNKGCNVLILAAQKLKD